MTLSASLRTRTLLALVAVLAPGCGLSEYPRARPNSAGSGGTSGPGPGDGSGGAIVAPPDGGVPANDSGAAPDASVVVDAPPGAGVMINGQFVAKENVVVFLHIGHSNMAGRTNTPASLRPLNFETDPHLWTFAEGNIWRLAKEPLSGDYLTRMNAGPGMSILHTALGLASQKMMVSIGRGHDGSIGGWCASFRKGALLYHFVMDLAVQLKGKVTFGGIFTMLGVNEWRRDLPNLPRFNECLAGVASDMRTDLGNQEIPFILGDWEAGATGDFAPTKDYAIQTREQMRIAITKIPRSVLIPTEMLPMSDDHHYDLTGYKLWSERGFDLLKTSNLVPWASP